MKTLLGSTGLLSILLVTAGCGAGLKCADGTFKSGDKCISYDPDDETAPVTTLDPPGGKTRFKTPTHATLTSNEPALIYWTNDGTEPTTEGEGHPSPALVTDLVEGATVKFFAVDLAGNVAPTTTTTFVFDPNAPARVSNFSLAFVGSDAQLTWTNPTDPDYQGTLLARVSGLLDAQPELDQFYTAGAVLSSNVQIVQVGTQTNFTDPDVGPGDVRYVAWAFDDIANYSGARSVRAQLIGSTSGSISVNVTTNTVTVPVQPANLVLSGTSSFSAGTLTLNLTVENLTTHYFQSPKILVNSVSAGIFSNSDGAIGGQGTKYYGPNHLSPGDVATRTLTFTGVLVTDVVVLNVSLIEHPFLFSADNRQNDSLTRFNDSRFGGALGNGVAAQAAADGNANRGMARPGCASSDGRYFYIGYQHFGRVDRYDLATRVFANSIALPTRNWSSTVLCDADSDGLYVIQIEGARRNNGSGNARPMSLLKLAPDLTELGKVDFTAIKGYGLHAGSVAPGGRFVAVTPSEEIVFIDTSTMTVFDADLSTPEVDNFQSGIFGNGNSRGVRNSAWSDDGKTLYAQGAFTDGIYRISMPYGPVQDLSTVTPFSADVGCCRGGDVELGPDGRVWIASDGGLDVFDPMTEVLTDTAYPSGARGIEFIDGEMYVQRNNLITVDVVDTTTGAVVAGRTVNLPSTNRQHGLRSSKTN